jgi:hypothetical protein
MAHQNFPNVARYRSSLQPTCIYSIAGRQHEQHKASPFICQTLHPGSFMSSVDPRSTLDHGTKAMVDLVQRLDTIRTINDMP